MENGMLWFDDRKDIPIEQKIQDAVIFFQKKYGDKPDCCYVNGTSQQKEIFQKLAGLRIEISQYVMPNHFLLERDH
ncbi:MAG: hypothetical protein ACYC59_06715 [Anaerolineaceae bacterium]